MPYPNTTPGTYKIPYWAKDDRANSQSNLRAAQIIDNSLRASNQFFGANGVIQEGNYAGVYASNASSVTLAANGAIPSLEAVVAFKYCKNLTSLEWSGLPDNSTVYLYAQALEQNIYTPTQLSTLQDRITVAVWNTSGSTPAEAILLGIATTTTAAITIDTAATIFDNGDFIDGKPTYYSFTQHRTAVPFDHPDLSVTDSKLADSAIISRALAPWDNLSSGTDSVEGKGVARDHFKPASVSIPKLGLSQNLNLDITGNIDLVGYARFSSGLQTPTIVTDSIQGSGLVSIGLTVSASFVSGVQVIGGLRGYNRTLLSSGLDVYGPSIFRGTLVVPDADIQAPITHNFTVTGNTTLSGLQYPSNSDLTFEKDIAGRSGVSAAAGYAGKVHFYRQQIGFFREPNYAYGTAAVLVPIFPFIGVVTEVLLEFRAPTTADYNVFSFANSPFYGEGEAVGVFVQKGERYASGVSDITMNPALALDYDDGYEEGTVLALYGEEIYETFPSGVNVYVSGYQMIPRGQQ